MKTVILKAFCLIALMVTTAICCGSSVAISQPLPSQTVFIAEAIATASQSEGEPPADRFDRPPAGSLQKAEDGAKIDRPPTDRTSKELNSEQKDGPSPAAASNRRSQPGKPFDPYDMDAIRQFDDSWYGE